MKEINLFNQESSEMVKIHFDGEMVSLTDLWKSAGSPNKKDPSTWVSRESTIELIETVCSFLNTPKSGVLKSKRGKTGGGTWAHKNLALSYSKYLSPKLAVLVNQSFFERIEEEKNPDLILDRYENHYLKKGKSKEWIAKRMKARDTRNVFTGVLAAHGVNNDGFKNCTNAVYEPLFDGSTGVIRQKLGIEKGESIRDNMSSLHLSAVELIEQLAAQRIEKTGATGNINCEIETRKVSNAFRNCISNALK